MAAVRSVDPARTTHQHVGLIYGIEGALPEPPDSRSLPARL